MLSPEYFVENFCWLQQKASAGVSDRDSILPFEMGKDPSEAHFFQRKILRWLHKRKNVLTLKSRRVGCSWIAAAYAAWMINFYQNVNVLFISRNGSEARKILAKVKFVLKNLAYHDTDDLRKATRAPWLKGEFAADNQERIAVAYKDDEGQVVTTSEVLSFNNTDDAARGEDATFVVFDELAFYEHPDVTWSSAMKTLARGGHWMAISTPSGIGDVFHRMCEQGDLVEIGQAKKEQLGYEYIKIHWSEAGITQDMVDMSNIGSTDELAAQEWEFNFITPGSVVFHPTHLLACFKPTQDHPEVAVELEKYRAEVMKLDGQLFYYSAADSAVAKRHRKSNRKDFQAFTALTKSGIQAFAHVDQEPLSEWAGMSIPENGRMVDVPGTVTKLHAEWPGWLQIEEDGPGHTVINRYQHPPDTFSTMHPVSMKHLLKRGIIQRLILKIEAHAIVITDLRTYQQLSVFQQVDTNIFSAPLGYNDDLVMALALANDALEQHGSLAFPWGDTADQLQRASIITIMNEPPLRLYGAPVVDTEIPRERMRQTDLVIEDDILPHSRSDELPYEYLIEELVDFHG